MPWDAVAFFPAIALFEFFSAKRLWEGKAVGRLRVERQDSWAPLLVTCLPIGLASAFFVLALLVTAVPSRGIASLICLSVLLLFVAASIVFFLLAFAAAWFRWPKWLIPPQFR